MRQLRTVMFLLLVAFATSLVPAFDYRYHLQPNQQNAQCLRRYCSSSSAQYLSYRKGVDWAEEGPSSSSSSSSSSRTTTMAPTPTPTLASSSSSSSASSSEGSSSAAPLHQYRHGRQFASLQQGKKPSAAAEVPPSKRIPAVDSILLRFLNAQKVTMTQKQQRNKSPLHDQTRPSCNQPNARNETATSTMARMDDPAESCPAVRDSPTSTLVPSPSSLESVTLKSHSDALGTPSSVHKSNTPTLERDSSILDSFAVAKPIATVSALTNRISTPTACHSPNSEASRSIDKVVDEDTIPDIAETSPLTTVDPDALWLGQYNRHRVATLLLSKQQPLTTTTTTAATAIGASEHSDDANVQLAWQAGECVQAQALARTARRRVRQFLKERDQAWRRPIYNSGLAVPATGSYYPTTNESSPRLRTETNTATSADDITITNSCTNNNNNNNNNLEQIIDLLISYGLTAKDIAEIFIHTPGTALMSPYPISDGNGESLQQTMDRVFVRLLCDTLQLRKYDARKVLRIAPGLLTMRGSRSAQQMVELLSRLGVSASSIARDRNALPVLLRRSPAAVFRLVAFLSSDTIRMKVIHIGPLLRRVECQVLLDVVAPVIPRMERTETAISGIAEDRSQHGMNNEGVSENDAITAASSFKSSSEESDSDFYESTDPGVIAALWGRESQLRREKINQIYQNMTTTASILRHEIGTADLGRVIAAYPAVLLLDAERQILPVAKFLMHELGIWEHDLPRVLQLYPTLLGYDLGKMRNVADYFISLDVAPENFGSIFRAFPALLTLDIETSMMPVVNFLKGIGVGNIGRFVSRLPPILGYSVQDDLIPKWQFLSTIYRDPRFEVSKFPAYFSYPLERVIQTRYEYLRTVKCVPTQLFALDQVLRFGDRDFAVKVALDQDHGAAFAAYAEACKDQRSGMTMNGRKRKQQQQQRSGKRRKTTATTTTPSHRLQVKERSTLRTPLLEGEDREMPQQQQ